MDIQPADSRLVWAGICTCPKNRKSSPNGQPNGPPGANYITGGDPYFTLIPKWFDRLTQETFGQHVPSAVVPSAPKLEDAYRQYLPVFFRALGHLSRRGFPLAPDETLDVVHDFFVDAWPGLEKRFAAEKGTFSAYIGVAFTRFARRRIAQMAAWRGRMRDLREIVRGPHDGVPEPSELVATKENLASLRGAVERLPPSERAVLQDAVDSGDSERVLAARHGVTRHRIRQAILDGMGRVAANMASRREEPVGEWQVARTLWKDGRSPRDVALRLGIPLSDVTLARRRRVERLIGAIRTNTAVPMPGASPMPLSPWMQLLHDTTLSQGNTALLEKVRQHRTEIRKVLAEGEDVAYTEDEQVRIHDAGEWLASVYEVLGETEMREEDQSELDAAIARALGDEVNEIQTAFAEGLIQELPDDLLDWDACFAGLKADPQVVKILQREIVVEFNRDRIMALAEYGITSVVVLEACEGIRLLLNRFLTVAAWPRKQWPASTPWMVVLEQVHAVADAGARPRYVVARSESQADGGDGVYVPWTLLVEEVQTTRDCSPQAAEPLVRWIVEVARVRPLVIPDYVAELSGSRGVAFWAQAQERRQSLYHRWVERRADATPRPAVRQAAGMRRG
ncbi:MAG: sigma-70 family RNA polymerase sigma factor [Planctomycetia bacterium]|nr:sigma-70 family RNA polymerase sigma factor [Planctomycetia bacterium]